MRCMDPNQLAALDGMMETAAFNLVVLSFGLPCPDFSVLLDAGNTYASAMMNAIMVEDTSKAIEAIE